MRLMTAACALLLLLVAVWPVGGGAPPDRTAAQLALTWVGAQVADAPRRDGDVWEVDVHRSDGSLVEVTLGERLELKEIDEEYGPAGTPSDDQVQGRLRVVAADAARAAAGPGLVLGVERELQGGFEVDLRRPDGSLLEVELDRGLRVLEVAPEDPGDE